MRVLALEASTDIASVAFWDSGAVVFEETFASKRSLSADLFPRLWRLLEPVGHVDRLAVGLGPGSYAGVRIAIAAALGMQSVWGCELVGIPSVAGMPAASSDFQVIGDARRGTWYYTRVQNGECVKGPLLAESEDALRAFLKKGGEPVYATEALDPRWGAEVLSPSACVLAGLAAAGRGIVQWMDLEPLYLRDAHITKPTTLTA